MDTRADRAKVTNLEQPTVINNLSRMVPIQELEANGTAKWERENRNTKLRSEKW